MIKLIASDMDGTLLNDKMEVSKKNADAIKLAQKNGIEFLIATGRNIHEAKPFLDSVNVHPSFITLNGGEIYNENIELVASHPINKDAVLAIRNLLDSNNIYYELITNKGVYSNSYESRLTSIAELMVLLNPHTSYEEALETTKEKMDYMTTTYVDSYDEITDNDEFTVIKFIVISKNGRDYLKDIVQSVEKEYNLVTTSSSQNNIEINSYNAQKGLALMNYAQQRGYAADEVMSIGDNLNDYSMIKMAGIGVAMGNAIPEIKEIAKMVTENNVNDGVAKIIERVVKEKI